jgi:hypothetical protein
MNTAVVLGAPTCDDCGAAPLLVNIPTRDTNGNWCCPYGYHHHPACPNHPNSDRLKLNGKKDLPTNP